MKKRLLLAAMLALGGLLLCGCGYPPMERQTFPICMSVDTTEEGKIQVGVQAPKNGDSSASAYDILSATGDSLEDALHILAASTPYPLNFCQLRLCLIGYDLASTNELRGLLRGLEEMPSMRPNAFVMVALGSGLEVMNAQQPDFGMRLSTHLNLLFERLREEDMLPDSTLSACVRDLGEGRRDPLLCICAVNAQLLPEEKKQGGDSSGGGAGGSGGGSGGSSATVFAVGEPWTDSLLPDQIIAGMLPRTSVNPVEYLGSAAVSDGRVSGLLTARETQVALRAWDEAERRAAIGGDPMQLQLWVREGTALQRESQSLLDVMKKLQALDCDALGFGGVTMGAFYTDAEWEAFQFRRKYRDADFVVCAK